MSEVSIDTVAFSKVVLHAAKYPHCAVNGVLLADTIKLRDGSKLQQLDIVDTIPLFHHSHNLSPMAEIALTQIENLTQTEGRVIAGYYAACENFNDNTLEMCPGQKIAEKIGEHFPAAVFIVIDNKKMVQNLDASVFKVYKYNDGKWKLKDSPAPILSTPYVLETASHLLQRGVQKDLIDFDNYLDDLSQDWTNLGIDKLIASINASNS